jgi:hypothetical protein
MISISIFLLEKYMKLEIDDSQQQLRFCFLFFFLFIVMISMILQIHQSFSIVKTYNFLCIISKKVKKLGGQIKAILCLPSLWHVEKKYYGISFVHHSWINDFLYIKVGNFVLIWLDCLILMVDMRVH